MNLMERRENVEEKTVDNLLVWLTLAESRPANWTVWGCCMVKHSNVKTKRAHGWYPLLIVCYTKTTSSKQVH